MPKLDLDPCPVEVPVLKRVYAARSEMSGILRIFPDVDAGRDPQYPGEIVVPLCDFSVWMTEDALRALRD